MTTIPIAMALLESLSRRLVDSSSDPAWTRVAADRPSWPPSPRAAADLLERAAVGVPGNAEDLFMNSSAHAYFAVHNGRRIAQHDGGRCPVRSNDPIKPDGVAGRRAVGSEAMRKRQSSGGAPPLEFVAGNGLLHRRALLQSGVMFAGALGSGASLPAPPPSRSPSPSGAFIRARSRRCCRHRPNTKRTWCARSAIRRATHAPNTRARRCKSSTAPSRRTRCISPSIIPAFPTSTRRKHVLVIHGMVKQPLEFTVDDADALPDGDAQAFRRMRRQQRADVLAGADPGAAAGAARPGVLRRMDRRAGCRPCSTRPASIRRRPGCWPRAPIRSQSAAACR